MLKLTIFITIIIQSLISSSLVFCDDNDTSHPESDDIEYSKDDINLDSTNYDNSDENINYLQQMEDFIDPNSLYYDRSNKKIINDKEIFPKKHSEEYQVETKNNGKKLLKESNEDCETLKVYYKRLIKMLLLYANLKTDDETVEGQLFIRGTTTQIETLRKIETENYSIKEIDIILGKILLEPSLFSNVSDMFNSNWDIQSALKFINQYAYVIIIVCSLLGIMIFLRKILYFSPFFSIIIIILIISFYMTWLELIMDAEIKFAAMQTKYIEMPAACQPFKMSIWERMLTSSNDNECEKYYEARISNPVYQITPIKVITHMITNVITYPIPIIGSTISEFTETVTSRLPWFARYVVQIILLIVLPIYILLAILTFRGSSISFGIPFYNLSLSTSKQTSVPLDHAQKRQTIELIREIFTEVPPNILLQNTQSVKAVVSSDTSEKQENNSSTNNAIKASYKLIDIKSEKELDHASGDSDKNNLFSKETQEEIGECVERLKIDTEKYIGGGDG